VLAYSSGTLTEVGSFNGFSRVFPQADGSRPLWNQDLSLTQELRVLAPRSVTVNGRKFSARDTVKLPRELNNDQLFGFAFGDWDANGTEDMAVLLRGERLRVFFDSASWTASDRMGGTKNDFLFSNHRPEDRASLYSRMISWKGSQAKERLLVPYNIGPSGLRFSYMKSFRESQIQALEWKGLEMEPVWRIPFESYLADFGVGDVAGSGADQLWALLAAPNGKSQIVAYSLPK
jgi:hypothetical protein